MIHLISLRITKQCPDRPMSKKAIAKWVLEQFRGCEYGSVEVIEVAESPDKPTPEELRKPDTDEQANCKHLNLFRAVDLQDPGPFYECCDCGLRFDMPVIRAKPKPGERKATDEGYDKLAKGWVGTEAKPQEPDPELTTEELERWDGQG